MHPTQAAILALIAGVALANLPFALLRGSWRRAAGWLFGYLLWAGLGALLARALDPATPGGWEVQAVGLALFAVLAFPGIVWCYLLDQGEQHG